MPRTSITKPQDKIPEEALKQVSSGGAKAKDAGATHALRTGTPEEISKSTPTSVSLALGTAELFLPPAGVVLSAESVSPIAPLGE